jgi:hypothetical protein
MLIKFVKPDPRAGDVARLDSHRAQQFIDAGTAERVPEGAPAPQKALRDGGPTVQEFVDAGYLAVNYPPTGYASKSTPEEIAAAVVAASSPDQTASHQPAEPPALADGAAPQPVASDVPAPAPAAETAPAAAPALAPVAKAPAQRKAPTVKK